MSNKIKVKVKPKAETNSNREKKMSNKIKVKVKPKAESQSDNWMLYWTIYSFKKSFLKSLKYIISAFAICIIITVAEAAAKKVLKIENECRIDEVDIIVLYIVMFITWLFYSLVYFIKTIKSYYRYWKCNDEKF